MGKTIELVGKQAVKKVKARKTDKNSDKIFVVKEKGISNEGLVLAPGDQYRILEKDKDSILIEKIGDNNNPYFVDADLLKNVTE